MAQVISIGGKVVTLRPRGEYFDLKEMQKIVGGLIEVVRCPCFPGDRRVMIVNENGLSENLIVNKMATVLYQITHHPGSAPIVGDVIVCETVETSDGEEFI